MQATLATACRDRAMAARDWRLRSAWIGHFARILGAMAATGSAIARLRAASGRSAVLNLGAPRLPSLPHVPGGEGDPPPLVFSKTTSGGFANRINRLENEPAKRPRAKPKGGAPRGNGNARKSGCHTAAFQEFGRSLSAYRRELRVQLDRLAKAVPRSPRRVLYLIETPTRCYARVLLKGRPAQDRDNAAGSASPFPIGRSGTSAYSGARPFPNPRQGANHVEQAAILYRRQMGRSG